MLKIELLLQDLFCQNGIICSIQKLKRMKPDFELARILPKPQWTITFKRYESVILSEVEGFHSGNFK